jgi:small-conductance mechanosensitive channel
MDQMPQSLSVLWQVLPLLMLSIAALLLIWGLNRIVFDRLGLLANNRLLRQASILGLACLVVVIGILLLPVGEETRGHLLSLLGLLFTAVIALSSTTLASNAMAGLMLRAMRSFHAGDFVRIGEHFGRVTEIGLFHTEIQTSNRDLTALPNAYIANNPATVVRHSGTIIEATLSIGYDVPHGKVEQLLLRAAEQVGLEDAFVLILDLGNFAVTYRIAGFLGETKRLVSAGTLLRRAVLDTLHQAGIEIASPNLMSQRPLAAGERLVPREPSPHPPETTDSLPEDIVFDKAEEAERIEQLRIERQALAEELKDLEGRRAAGDGREHSRLETEIAAHQRQLDDIDRFLAQGQ